MYKGTLDKVMMTKRRRKTKMNRLANTTLALVFLAGIVLIPFEGWAGRRGSGDHRGGSFKSFSPRRDFSGKKFSGSQNRSLARGGRQLKSQRPQLKGGQFRDDGFSQQRPSGQVARRFRRDGIAKSYSPRHKFSGKKSSRFTDRSLAREGRQLRSQRPQLKGGQFRHDGFSRQRPSGQVARRFRRDGISRHDRFQPRHSGRFGYRNQPRTRFFFGLNLYAPYAYYPNPVYPSYYDTEVRYVDNSQLQIEVTPLEAEIWVDGRYVGLARDFAGPAILYVAPGNHVVEIRLYGQSITSYVKVAPGATSVVNMAL